MPDLSDLLRKSATAELASYEPSAELPQHIARRTLQLQRRRRGRVVGAAFGLLVLGLPLVINTTRPDSNAVSIAYGPAPATATEADVTTTTTTVAVRLLDLQAFIDQGVRARSAAQRKFAAAVRKRKRGAAADTRDKSQVLDATAVRKRSPKQDGPSAGSSTTSTTNASATTTTNSTTTSTTTTSPTTPFVPLAIVPPDHVCAGVPAVFRATGTGADLVVWSNSAIGATATFVLTESTTVVARLDLLGSVSSQAVSVQVIPSGTPPC